MSDDELSDTWMGREPLTPSTTDESPSQQQSPTRGAVADYGGKPLEEADVEVTGSFDLSGAPKSRVRHYRIDDQEAMFNRYTPGRKLGQGSFGTVRLVQSRDGGGEYACKMFRKIRGSRASYEQMQREIDIMKQVRHPHIVQLFEVYETPKRVFLVMEHCAGGELVQQVRMQRYCSENDARLIISRLASAVGYLHSHGVVHRDIKPENILLASSDSGEYDLKLSDFGLATFVDNCEMMENIAGTPLYMAPEIIQNLGYSAQCDIWSIGVLFYNLLCGYKKDVENFLQTSISYGKIEYPPSLWKRISPGARLLCESMLKFDPAKRISAKEILMHPWTKGEEIDSSSPGATNVTVLDLMKSYNTQRKMRKVLVFALAAVRFWRGVFRHWAPDVPQRRPSSNVKQSHKRGSIISVSRDNPSSSRTQLKGLSRMQELEARNSTSSRSSTRTTSSSSLDDPRTSSNNIGGIRVAKTEILETSHSFSRLSLKNERAKELNDSANMTFRTSGADNSKGRLGKTGTARAPSDHAIDDVNGVSQTNSFDIDFQKRAVFKRHNSLKNTPSMAPLENSAKKLNHNGLSRGGKRDLEITKRPDSPEFRKRDGNIMPPLYGASSSSTSTSERTRGSLGSSLSKLSSMGSAQRPRSSRNALQSVDDQLEKTRTAPHSVSSNRKDSLKTSAVLTAMSNVYNTPVVKASSMKLRRAKTEEKGVGHLK